MPASSSGGGGTLSSGRFDGLPLDDSGFPSLNDTGNSTNGKKRKHDDPARSPQQLGARYIIIKPFKPDQPITQNPFRLAEDIDKMAGKVLDVKRLQSGDILVKTQTSKQAAAMIKHKQMPVTKTPVIVEDYSKLNRAKGKIFRRDFCMLSDDEILEGLREQNVVEIYRQKKKNEKGELQDSGVFILTFNSTTLPNFIYAGYARIKVNTYIPNPMRCVICLEYGHTSKNCKTKQRICASCGENSHDGGCSKPQQCINCIRAKTTTDVNHSALSRSCPVFKKEFEIQKIRTINNVSLKEAQKMYLAHPTQLSRTYAETARPKSCKCKCTCGNLTDEPKSSAVSGKTSRTEGPQNRNNAQTSTPTSSTTQLLSSNNKSNPNNSPTSPTKSIDGESEFEGFDNPNEGKVEPQLNNEEKKTEPMNPKDKVQNQTQNKNATESNTQDPNQIPLPPDEDERMQS